MAESRVGVIGRAWEAVESGRSADGVYGLLVSLAVATAASFTAPSSGVIAATVAGSAVVFWMAHIHAHLVALWTRTDGRPAWNQVRREAAHHLPMLVAALPALIVLSPAHLGVYGASTAVWILAAVTIALLAAWGIAIARIAKLGFAAGALITGVNIGMGLLIVLLKVVVTH